MTTERDLGPGAHLPPRNTDQAGVAREYMTESRHHQSNNPAETYEYSCASACCISTSLNEARQRIEQLLAQVAQQNSTLHFHEEVSDDMMNQNCQLEQQNKVMRNEIMVLRARLQAKIVDNHNLNIMRVENAKSLETARACLHDTYTKIDSLEKNLEECKSRVFRYQPFQGPTDEEVSRMYDGLCRDIEDLVHTGFSGDESAIFRLEPVHDGARQLFQIHGMFDDQELAAIHSRAGVAQAMLPSLLLRGLFHAILEPEKVSCGLPAEVEKYFGEMMVATKRLQPAKGGDSR